MSGLKQGGSAKRVAIITTHHEPNFGNKLQNYAMQTVIRNLGFHVEVVNDARSWPDLTSFYAQRKNILHLLIPFRSTPLHVKYVKFFFWSKKYIRYSKVNIHSDNDITGLFAKYDFFVVGSDQIWNPYCPIFSNDFGFASFARKEQKIAYAPSFGVSTLPRERFDEYKIRLKDWKALSCREYEGAAIVKAVTGIDVPVVLDPTLLLSSDDWNLLSVKRLVKVPYLLFYGISGYKNEYKVFVQQTADERNLIIVNLSEGKFSGSSPGEFISLIRYASLLITDSFHGCAFALRYHIPLFIINRTLLTAENDTMSRISTLFRNAGLSDCLFSELFNDFTIIDWNVVDKALAKMRDFSMGYLKKSFE